MRFVYKVGIVALFASFFLMSHNSYATSKTIYLKNGLYAYGIPATTGSQGGNSVTPLSGQSINLYNNVYKLPGNKIWYSLAWRLNPDDSNMDLSAYTDYTFTLSYCSEVPAYFVPTSNDQFRMTDFSQFEGISYDRFSGTNYAQQNPESFSGTFTSTDKCSTVITKGKVGTNSYNKFQLGTTSNGSFTRVFDFNQNDLYTMSSSDSLYLISPTVVLYDEPNEADDAIQKEKQNVQNAADNSETEAEGNSTSTQTTNLIGAFQSFVTALTNLSSTNCNVTLAWPSSLGGNMQVNICQNKDYAGNIISVFGSLTLIVFYIPFSLKILSMIYNEIRSFTNG